MGLFNRLFRIGKAEANAAVDNLEDATKISKQSLLELEQKVQEAVVQEAKIKAIDLQNKAAVVSAQSKVDEWGKRVNAILDKIDAGDKNPELEPNSKIAAERYNEAIVNLKSAEEVSSISGLQFTKMDNEVKKLKETIRKAGDDVHNIEARQIVADASLTINKATSSMKSDGLTSTIERMKTKVAQTEFTSEAYADVTGNLSAEESIDALIGSTSTEDTLASFRANRTKKA